MSRLNFSLISAGRTCLFERTFSSSPRVMAKSKFEYVKNFELDDRCLPNTWIVVRVDGKGFHKFTDEHDYEKPNDNRGLALMTSAAKAVMEEFKDVCISYGQSDEYSFVFRKECHVYGRRAAKLSTNVSSLFTSAFVMNWDKHFDSAKPKYPPVFDGRVVLYPSDKNMKDYLSWRQADCHINNLYNTTFWMLVLRGGCTPAQAEERIRHTLAGDKNEILFSEFGINYNFEPELYRKGTTLIRKKTSQTNSETGVTRERSIIVELTCDIIRDDFWNENSFLLDSKETKISNQS